MIRVRPLGAGDCEITHVESGVAVRSSKSAAFGGSGASFSSTDLLAAALGSCIATDLEPVAERHGLALGLIGIAVDKQLSLTPKRVVSMHVRVTLPASVDDVLLLKLERAAAHCLVQRSLSPDLECRVEFERVAPSGPATHQRIDPACVFCRIVAGEEAATRVHESERVVAFLDIRPVRAGQTLIVPRHHVDHFSDLDDDVAREIFLLGQRISRVLRNGPGAPRAGMVVHGFGVPHAHLIVLPLHHAPDITSSANAAIENGEIRFRRERVPLATRADLEGMAAIIRAGLAQDGERAGDLARGPDASRPAAS